MWRHRADPTLNGHLKYPHNLDQSLNDAPAEKIRKYRADYNNRPPSAVSFMPAIASMSGRLHSEFVRLLFLQTHRETDRFFAASGVQSAQSTSVFHFHRAAFLQQLKSKVGLALAKTAALRIVLNLDASSSTTNPVCERLVDLLVCSLPLHRHSYIGFILDFASSFHNKQQILPLSSLRSRCPCIPHCVTRMVGKDHKIITIVHSLPKTEVGET